MLYIAMSPRKSVQAYIELTLELCVSGVEDDSGEKVMY